MYESAITVPATRLSTSLRQVVAKLLNMPRARNGRFAKKSTIDRQEKVSELAKKLVETARQKKLAKRKEEELRQPVTDAGRRIVDFSLLARTMWCSSCDIPLSFRGLEKEIQRGLASVCFIRCGTCLKLEKITTSTTVKLSDNSGYPLYAVNCKAAAGCMDSGIGYDQLNTFLSAMNCPIVHRSTMKRAEDRVGHAFEAAANDSCAKAVLEEKSLTVESARLLNGTPETSESNASSSEEDEIMRLMEEDNPGIFGDSTAAPQDTEVGITVEYDFGWDKRGSGFAYNSTSGRGSVIGYRTHKVLAWQVMSTTCAMCSRGHSPDVHDCRKNHSGSSKAMEPKAAVELMAKNESFKSAGVRVDVLVGDEDAATYCHVQQATDHHVEKWVDTNHALKKFNNKLYTAAKTHRFLNATTIKYLKRCFGYAVSQNKSNPDGLKAALRNLVDHTFGSHDNCGEWCKAKNFPESYEFQHLPNRKPFSCPKWRVDFEAIINHYVEKADKIAPGGSSQRNESFNHMVVTRAPKSRFYGSSPALSFRVAAAVLQKNEGATFLQDVNQRAGLSPGKVTQKYRKIIEERRQKKAAQQATVDYKRRRLFLKQKAGGAAVQQRKEGFSYVSGMSTTMERAVAATCTLNAWIPERSVLQEGCAVVLVDVETTGFGGDAQIIQIAAQCGNNTYNAYILPTKKINPIASEKTGLSVEGGSLLYHGERVETTPPAAVARDFLAFIQQQGNQVVLAGHNLLRFDAPLILKWLQSHSLARALCGLVFGFTDTVPLLKQGKVAKQDELAKTYLTSPEWKRVINGAHNAASDCLLLSGLLDHFKVSPATLKDKAVPTSEFLEHQAMARKQKTNLPSLLTMKGIVSAGMLNKMARHGITIEDLKSEYKLHGRQGVKVSLGVQVRGKPRVTTSKKIVDSVCDFIEKLCGECTGR